MSVPLGKGVVYGAAILAIVAIVLAGVSIGLVLVRPAGPQPVNRDFFLVGGEWKTTLPAGTILPPGTMFTNGTVLTQQVTLTKDEAIERYRWDPVALIVNKGDTVKITVHIVNGVDHTFIISDPYNVNVTDLDKVFRYTPAEKPGLQFVADKAGIFEFVCTTHVGMTGHLIVMD